MVKISASELAKLAELSSLELSQDEAVRLSHDLENILEYVHQLSDVDTSGVEPTYQVLDLRNVWREDEIEMGVAPESLLNLQDSAQIQARQIKVPKVL